MASRFAQSRRKWAGILLGAAMAAAASCSGDEAQRGDRDMETTHEFTNRLAGEKSPYLLQHAHNPVDWYPWGDEALEKARAEDKPIFLSVGYSTCHWCHVMERESFENEEIAAVLNRHFVAIKVDREERPDIDNLYMTAVQGLTGRGGWPMSVFLTPEGKPFFGGTYFPPEERMGMPGFKTILQNIATAWSENRSALVEQGDKVADFLRSQTAAGGSGEGRVDRELLDAAYRSLEASYDSTLGGFGSAPKFPTPHKITYLLRYAERTGSGEAGKMARKTLDAMAAGGIHDHLGGGFHRYSTDPRWLAPHFEKMLYDQASLALAYTAAWRVFRDDRYAAVTRGILDYVLRDLRDEGGGFYSAEDADSEGEEGTFYVWSKEEIDSILGPERGDGFRKAYGVLETGNWEGKNILHLGTYEMDAVESWAEERRKLWEVREKRPRPHRDEKVITGWNGFMIEAMAGAGAAFGEPRYIEAAEEAARFIQENLRQGDRLLRHYKDGAADVPAYLDDYAYLGRGLLALYEATFDPEWLEQAVRLAADIETLFARTEGGYNLSGSDGEELLAPVVEIYDGAIPSGNSVAALFLLRLGHLTADSGTKEKGWKVLETFGEAMTRNPEAHLEMISAVDFALGPNVEIVIAGDADDAEIEKMWRVLRERYLPNAVVAFRSSGDATRMIGLIPYLEDQGAQGGQPTAYVCKDYACMLPVHDSDSLARQLKEN